MSSARAVAALLALAALPAAAQGGRRRRRSALIGEVGTWELAAAENTPGDDILVFARMTFTGDQPRHDGRLPRPRRRRTLGPRHDDAYLASRTGSSIVRAPGSTTVLDVSHAPTPSATTLLVVHDLRTGVVLTLHPADPAAGARPGPRRHVGRDGSAGTRGRSASSPTGRSFVRRDDQNRDHEEPYTVAGPYLLVDQDAYHFTFAGGRLMLDRRRRHRSSSPARRTRPPVICAVDDPDLHPFSTHDHVPRTLRPPRRLPARRPDGVAGAGRASPPASPRRPRSRPPSTRRSSATGSWPTSSASAPSTTSARPWTRWPSSSAPTGRPTSCSRSSRTATRWSASGPSASRRSTAASSRTRARPVAYEVIGQDDIRLITPDGLVVHLHRTAATGDGGALDPWTSGSTAAWRS